MLARLAALVVLFCLGAADAALATSPGSNGVITIGVYPDSNSGQKRIDQLNPDGSNAGGLDADTANLTSFSWSANGSQLIGYYNPYPSTGRPAGVYVVSEDGKTWSQITSSYSNGYGFLPDGKVILLRSQSGADVPQGSLWIANNDGSEMHRILPSVAMGFVPGATFAPDGTALYYTREGDKSQGKSDEIRRLDLATGDDTRVYSRVSNGGQPTILTQDVAPNGKQLLISEETGSAPGGGDDVQPAALYVINTDGSGFRKIPTPSGDRPSGVYSPDGTRIVYLGGHQSHDAGAQDPLDIEVHTVGADGQNDQKILTYPALSQNGFTGIAWQPGPGLVVGVSGGTLLGDLVELDLGVGNVSNAPFGNLRYDEGGAQGLVFNTALYSPAFQAKYTVIGGPVPGLAANLGAGQALFNHYLVGIDRPGNVQVRAKVYATSPTTGEIAREDTTYIVARRRPLDKWEQAATMAGGYGELHAKLQKRIAAVKRATWDKIAKAAKKALPPKQEKKLLKPTKREEAEARALGLPDDSLALLPNDPEKAQKALYALIIAEQKAEQKVVEEHLDSAYKSTIRTPYEFWSEHVDAGPYAATIGVGTELYDESAYWAEKGADKAVGFGKDFYNLIADPHNEEYADQAIGASYDQISNSLSSIKATSAAKVKGIVSSIRKDPEKTGARLGDALGTAKGEISMTVAEGVFTDNALKVVSGITNAGKRIRQVEAITEETAWGLDASRDLDATGAAAKATKALPTVAELGMPKRDVTRWQSIVAKLEDVAASHGIKVDLQLSFRPRNVHSAAIEDGLGKNMFVKKIKAGDDLDVLLGMDPEALGKAAVYDPKLPPNFKELPADMQAQIKSRASDMKAGFDEWHDTDSYINKARRKGGVTASDSIAGNKTTTVHMKVSGVERNGTVMVRYEELTVDGRKILKGSQEPKWMVSDYDGNAFLQVSGKNLPPSTRGLLELELMRLQREAAVTKDGVAGMATSFHGFTKNGFDTSLATYRNTFKFLLEGLPDAQAKKMLDLYLKKYDDGKGGYQKLLEVYKSGDYVVQVTRDSAVAAQGF